MSYCISLFFLLMFPNVLWGSQCLSRHNHSGVAPQVEKKLSPIMSSISKQLPHFPVGVVNIIATYASFPRVQLSRHYVTVDDRIFLFDDAYRYREMKAPWCQDAAYAQLINESDWLEIDGSGALTFWRKTRDRHLLHTKVAEGTAFKTIQHTGTFASPFGHNTQSRDNWFALTVNGTLLHVVSERGSSRAGNLNSAPAVSIYPLAFDSKVIGLKGAEGYCAALDGKDQMHFLVANRVMQRERIVDFKRAEPVEAFAVGTNREYVLLANGEIWAQGFNDGSRLGIGVGDKSIFEPRKVPLGSSKIIKIVAGDHFVLMLADDGRLFVGGVFGSMAKKPTLVSLPCPVRDISAEGQVAMAMCEDRIFLLNTPDKHLGTLMGRPGLVDVIPWDELP
jgi:hypothetical protein